MVGTTLVDIRANIEALASDGGAYYLVCARTGERPFPAGALRFPSRAVARNAARATEQYRATLRRYDPQVPRYDVVVCETDAAGAADSPADDTPERLTEYCHGVAAAVFEALTDLGFAGVESAAMDAYLELAETLSDPDDLCLRLLEAMATELDDRLDAEEQAAVVARAARSLDPAPDDAPVEATFERLRRVGLLREFSREGSVVEVSGYALAPREERLPVLPIAVDLARRGESERSVFRAATTAEGWRLTLHEGSGLASAPVRGGA